MTKCYEDDEMSIHTQIRAQLAQNTQHSSNDIYFVPQQLPIIPSVRLPQVLQSKKWKQVATVFVIAGAHVGLFWTAEHLPKPTLELTKIDPVVMEIVQPEPLPQTEEIQPPEIPPIAEQSTEPPPVQQVQPKQIQPQVKPVEAKPVPQPQPVEKAPAVESEPLPQQEPLPAPQPVPKVEDAPITQARGYAGYLSNPAPEYPDVALERGWEGDVILRVKVSAAGLPLSVNVQKSSGKKVLDDTAVKTVKRWKFSPAKQGNQAIEGWVEVPIGFQLPK